MKEFSFHKNGLKRILNVSTHLPFKGSRSRAQSNPFTHSILENYMECEVFKRTLSYLFMFWMNMNWTNNMGGRWYSVISGNLYDRCSLLLFFWIESHFIIFIIRNIYGVKNSVIYMRNRLRWDEMMSKEDSIPNPNQQYLLFTH